MAGPHTLHDPDPRDDADEEEQGREQLQRHHRESGHQIEIQPNQPAERILAFSGCPFGMGHL
jgi:hypothetical protein